MDGASVECVRRVAWAGSRPDSPQDASIHPFTPRRAVTDVTSHPSQSNAANVSRDYASPASMHLSRRPRDTYTALYLFRWLVSAIRDPL